MLQFFFSPCSHQTNKKKLGYKAQNGIENLAKVERGSFIIFLAKLIMCASVTFANAFGSRLIQFWNIQTTTQKNGKVKKKDAPTQHAHSIACRFFVLVRLCEEKSEQIYVCNNEPTRNHMYSIFESRIRLVNTKDPSKRKKKKWRKLPFLFELDQTIHYHWFFPSSLLQNYMRMHPWTDNGAALLIQNALGETHCLLVMPTKSLMSLMRKFKQNQLVIAFKKLFACNAYAAMR